MKGWCLRENKEFDKAYKIITSDSEVDDIFTGEWIKAAEIRHNMRKSIKDFGFIDALILAKKNIHKCKIVSGDKHFKSLDDVVYIGD